MAIARIQLLLLLPLGLLWFSVIISYGRGSGFTLPKRVCVLPPARHANDACVSESCLAGVPNGDRTRMQQVLTPDEVLGCTCRAHISR